MKQFVHLLVLAFTALSCNTTDPPVDLPKDPRTYTWARDTLAYPGSAQTIMYDIWASSPRDVYVVGHNDGGYGKMYHWDGMQWLPVDLLFGPIDLFSIYGFASNDVYAVGEHIYINPNPDPYFLDSSLVIHFDGVRWMEVNLERGRLLDDVSGSGPNEVWACGLGETLFHYDGASWVKESLSLATVPSGVGFKSIASSGASAYLSGSLVDNELGRWTYYFLERNNGRWALIDTFVIDAQQGMYKWGPAGMWISPSGALFSFGEGAFRRVGNSWTLFFPSATVIRSVFGNSEENMFAVGDFGKVYHYNGSDWYQFKNLDDPTVVYTGVWTDGKEAFVVGYTAGAFPQKTIVLHGK